MSLFDPIKLMVFDIKSLNHFLLEYEPWMASCIILIPIPAIPKPLIMYRIKSKTVDESDPNMINTNGVKNNNSIAIDLMIMVWLPNLLISLLFRYSDTRFLSVDEKSDCADFENEIVLIEKVLIIH